VPIVHPVSATPDIALLRREMAEIAAVEIEIAMLCPGAGSQQHDRAAKNAHRGEMDERRGEMTESESL
jgi:hypothetical protein